MLETWPLEWCTPDLANLEKTVAQKRKNDAKLCITQLAEKRHNEKVVAKVRVACEIAQEAAEKNRAIEATVVAQIEKATTMQVEEVQVVSAG